MSTILLNSNNLNTENVIIAIIGIIIVFLSLSVLYLFLKLIPKIIEWQIRGSAKNKGLLNGQKYEQLPSGVDAAISAALFLYFNEIHDEENAIMTIKKVSKTYSPWSSKIYSVRWPMR